jgi:hypothetical protein
MSDTITLPLADVAALVKLAWELTRHIEETDKSATGSIYGIEYADKTIAKVAVQLERPVSPEGWFTCAEKLPDEGARVIVENVAGGVQLAVWWGFSRGWTKAGLAYALDSKPVRWHLIPAR